MNEEQPIVKLKLDVIFKRVFGNENNKDIIAAFLSALLEIPREDIREVYIHNVEMPPEYLDQKFSRLDLRLDVDGQTVNVEIQVKKESYFKDRTLFYWSKLFSEELKVGGEYSELKRTVCMNIINFNLFECPEYHSYFQVMENERHEVLSDKFAIHFFELKKVNNAKQHKPMEDWLKLINAETEGDLMNIQQTTAIPEVKDTIVMLRRLSADEKVRQEAYYREKRLHDEATELGAAKREGRAEGIAEGRAEGIAEGIAEGRAEGRAEGIAEGIAKEQAKLIQKWRKKGLTEQQIKELLE